MQPQEKKLGYTIYRTLLCIILSGTWYGMAAVSAGSVDFQVKTFGVFYFANRIVIFSLVGISFSFLYK
jgi:hypothetical protein